MKAKSCQASCIMENNSSGQSQWDVKQLLIEWKLERILPHLLAQDIDGDILQMIKLPHIRMLLGSFTLGIQIRFEYNLEKWRCSIGKPLLDGHTCDDKIDSVTQKSSLPSRLFQDTSKVIPMTEIHCMPKPVVTNIPINARATSHSPEDPLMVNDDSAFREETQSTRSKASTLSYSRNDDSSMPYTSKPLGPVPKVKLREILMDCRPEGPQLIRIYRLNKYFSRTDRRRLVNLLVHYYLSNDLEFGLQTSYALERAILKMFPNERLEMYRRAKRGSIYSKYTSAKLVYKKLQQGDNVGQRRLKNKANKEIVNDFNDEEVAGITEDADATVKQQQTNATSYSGNQESAFTALNALHENNDPLEAKLQYSYSYIAEEVDEQDIKPSIIHDPDVV